MFLIRGIISWGEAFLIIRIKPILKEMISSDVRTIGPSLRPSRFPFLNNNNSNYFTNILNRRKIKICKGIESTESNSSNANKGINVMFQQIE